METTAMAKQMIGFQKSVFNNSFNALVVVQDQTETMMNNFMGQLPWATDESKQRMTEAWEMGKTARENFKKAIDEGYDRFEEMLNQK